MTHINYKGILEQKIYKIILSIYRIKNSPASSLSRGFLLTLQQLSSAIQHLLDYSVRIFLIS